MFARLFLLSAGRRNEAMEGLRGWAVALVFVTHFCGHYAYTFYGVNLEAGAPSGSVWQCVYWAFRSHYGVELFFLLSGFLVVRLLGRRQGRFRYGAYLAERLARILPAFLVTLVAVTLMLAAWRGAEVFDLRRFVANVLLLNGIAELGVQPYNAVTWSLFFEVVFYAVCPILLAFPTVVNRPTRFAAAAALLAIGLACLPGFYFRASMFLVGGWVAAHADDDLRRLAARVPDGVAVAAYLAATNGFAWLPADRAWQLFIPLFAGPAALLLVNGCYGRGPLNRLFCQKPLRLLGNISYSFYLLHAACISATIKLAARCSTGGGGAGHAVAVLLASAAVSVVAAAAVFVIFERGYFVGRGADAGRWRRYHAAVALPAACALAIAFAAAMHARAAGSAAPAVATTRATLGR